MSSTFPNFKGRGSSVQPRVQVTAMQRLVMAGAHSLLAAIVATSLSPPQVTRVIYLYFMSIATAYNWNNPGTLTGTNDGWNWDSAVGTPVPMAAAAALATQAVVGVVHGAIPILDTSSPWAAAWAVWFNGRQADGSATSNAIKAGDHLPNDVSSNGVWTRRYLDVTTVQPITTWENPSQWTPLTTGTGNQGFAGMHWRDVASTLDLDEASFDIMCDKMYPDPDSRTFEVDLVKNILTTPATSPSIDTRKVIAEFWALSCPETVTPPGFTVWLWMDYVQTFGNVSDIVFIKSGLEVGVGQFEVGRLTWRTKLRHMQARPIQEIRSRYAGQQIASWNTNTTIDGGLYLPYQAPQFVSPPFPDTASGHSAFAQIFANTMTKWFGAAIPESTPRRRTGLNLISPMMRTAASQRAPYATFTIPRRSSVIQATVPATPITLSYGSWQETADASGISRQYGGVHCLSAHYMSQAIANTLSPIIDCQWNLRP